MSKKICRIWFVAAFLCLASLASAEDIPQPRGWVNDFANVISEQDASRIEGVIRELESKTSAELFVVTVNYIAPHDERTYARMIFDSWRPGKKGKDNGVLILLAVQDRLWRIETGYGVEGILPDGLCGQIGRNEMVPYFKEGKYAEGLYRGAAAVATVIAKDAKVTMSEIEPRRPGISSYVPLFIFFPFFFFFLWFRIPRRKGRKIYRGRWYGGWWGGGWGGGGFGGGGGGSGGGGGAGGRF